MHLTAFPFGLKAMIVCVTLGEASSRHRAPPPKPLSGANSIRFPTK
jgi:hypothetical protein